MRRPPTSSDGRIPLEKLYHQLIAGRQLADATTEVRNSARTNQDDFAQLARTGTDFANLRPWLDENGVTAELSATLRTARSAS